MSKWFLLQAVRQPAYIDGVWQDEQRLELAGAVVDESFFKRPMTEGYKRFLRQQGIAIELGSVASEAIPQALREQYEAAVLASRPLTEGEGEAKIKSKKSKRS